MKRDFPISPYFFEQEKYIDDPWKMLIVCFMLNQTSYKQVDKVRKTFFEKYPDASELIKGSDEEIISIIRPLGLYNKRCKMWKRFSREWLELKTFDRNTIKELTGVGSMRSIHGKSFRNRTYIQRYRIKNLKNM
jgi:methyl-CpG-binding domain protein 4